MGQRIRTALIAIPIALLLIKLGGLFFSLGTLLLVAVAYKEYRDMIHAAGYDLYGKAAFLGIVLLVAAASLVFLDSSLSHALLVPVTILFSLLIMLDGLFHHGEGQFLEKTALSTLSLLYIGLPFAHFIFLRSLGEGLLWTVMVGTWASDTFAYFGGRMWGKTPLAPTVSPKKTREGALCGFLGTLAVIYLIGHTYLGYQSVRVLILALLVGFFAPLGDLVESIMKRCCKIKDSGTFFPGHGGVLDRCDSLIFSIPIAYYFVEFFLF